MLKWSLIKRQLGRDVPLPWTELVDLIRSIVDDLRATSFGYDASGRQRVSQITTLLDGKVLNADDSELFENTGTGATTFANNKITLSVTAGQYIIRQSKRYCPYFSGKSQFVEETFDGFGLQAGVIKRIGYFSSNAVAPYTSNYDGFWIESNGDDNKFYLNVSRVGTLTLNQDITSVVGSYDFDDFSVVGFDFLWLGGAVLRLFLKDGNEFKLIHKFDYSGTSQDTFTLSPNQPVRYEVRSTTGIGSMRYICCQVATEGGLNEAGKTLGVYNPSSITANAIGTIYALKGVRKVADNRDISVQILDASVANTASTDAGIILLILNPTLSTPLTWTSISRIEEGEPSTPATPPTITPGTGRVICALPMGASGTTSVMKENFLSFLSVSINNTADQYILAYRPTTNNQTVNGTINVKEY